MSDKEFYGFANRQTWLAVTNVRLNLQTRCEMIYARESLKEMSVGTDRMAAILTEVLRKAFHVSVAKCTDPLFKVLLEDAAGAVDWGQVAEAVVLLGTGFAREE